MRHAPLTAIPLLFACADQSGQLMPGWWEVTTRVETLAGANANSAGMLPTPPPLVTRHCLSGDEANRPNPGFLTGNGPRANCAYKGLSMKDGRIDAVVECNDGGAVLQSMVSGSYRPDSFEAKMNGVVDKSDLSLVLGSRVTGRRTGHCPDST